MAKKNDKPAQEQEKQPGEENQMTPKPKAKKEGAAYKGSGKLQGKVAIITGGDSGIGRAVAIAFAQEGADLAIAYLNEDKDAEETQNLVEEAGGKIILVKGNLAEAKQCEKLVAETIDAFGKIDILVNNAA